MTSPSNNEFILFAPNETKHYPFTTAAILPCYCSPEISAVGLEIDWFKESGSVLHYKNRQMTEGINYEGRVSLDKDELKRGNVSLQLRNCSLSDEGYYWCQVSDGGRKEELTVKVEIISQFMSNLFKGKGPGVYVSSVENSTKQATKKKKEEGGVYVSSVENKSTKQDMKKEKGFMQRVARGFWNSVTSGTSDTPRQNRGTQQKSKKKGKCFIIVTGKTLNSEKHFMDRLRKKISVEEVNTVQECDFILVFCSIVSQTGADIEAAMRELNDLHEADTKPVVFVVLHHTFDPDRTVPDSSRCVTRPNTITVDCLFYEDQGLLRCSKNDESLNKATDYIIDLFPSSLSRGTSISQKTSVGGFSSESTYAGLHKPEYAMGTGLNVQDIKAKDIQIQDMSISLGEELLSEGEKQQMDKDKQLQDKDKQLQDKDKQLKEEDKRLQEKDKRLQEKDKRLQEKDKRLQEKDKRLQDKDKQLQDKDKQLQDKDKQLQDKDKQLQDKDKQQMDKDKQQMDKDKQLQEKDKQLQEKDKQLQEKDKQVQEKDKQLQEKDKQLQEKDKQLQDKDKQLQDKQLQDKDKQLLEKDKQQMDKDKQLQKKDKQLLEKEKQL